MRPSQAFRRAVPVLAAASLVFAACGSDDDSADTADTAADTATTADTGTTAGSAAPAGASDCAATINDGTLTIATGEPAFFPWVIDDAPETGQGFEAAVALAVADEMGYEGDAVAWTRTTFDEAIQPGAEELRHEPAAVLHQRRAQGERRHVRPLLHEQPGASSPSTARRPQGATTVADLKDVKFGAQAGTTSLAFINDVIKPTPDAVRLRRQRRRQGRSRGEPDRRRRVRPADGALRDGVEIDGSVVVGQFPASAGGTTDEFGFVLNKDSALTGCVNDAIAAITDSGELDSDPTGMAVGHDRRTDHHASSD